MTNEELLAKIDEPNPTALYMTQVTTELAEETESYALKAFLKVGINPQVVVEQNASITKLKAQIRAVVELHKPYNSGRKTYPAENPEGVETIICFLCSSLGDNYYKYPCETVEAIEKALT